MMLIQMEIQGLAAPEATHELLDMGVRGIGKRWGNRNGKVF